MTKQKQSNSGCFSSMIRRMLCMGNIPTHPSSSSSSPSSSSPSNQIPDSKTTKPETELKQCPNIVARLMGLDSLPPSTQFRTTSLTPDSFSRSRSVNFMDYLLINSDDNKTQRQHRRVRTSVSFSEVVVSFKPPRRRDLVVVYLDGLSKPEKEKKKKKEDHKTNDNNKATNDNNNNNNNNSKIVKLKNEPRTKALKKDYKSENSSEKAFRSVLCRNGNVKSKVLLKKKNEKKVTHVKRKNHNGSNKIRSTKSYTENLNRASIDREGHSKPANSDSQKRPKVGPKIAYNGNDDFELRSIDKKNNVSTDNKDTLDFTELAEQLVNLTEQDLSKSHWFSNSKNARDFEDICLDIEDLILNVLLNEVTNEIVQIY